MYLIIVANLKPLVNCFGYRTLDEISNTRLIRLKQRTLHYVFEIHFMSGKIKWAADVALRHPVINNDLNTVDVEGNTERLMVRFIYDAIQKLFAIIWKQLVNETKKDLALTNLVNCIEKCFFLEQTKFSRIPALSKRLVRFRKSF